MKLTIKNFEKLFRKEWDDKNYVEDIDERRDEYRINVWRGHMRHIIILNRRPVELNPSAISDGIYEIGKWSNEAFCVRYPYWIKHEDIMNIDSLMDKLKLLTDDWTPKLL
jgi:hypothetical protein